MPTQETGSRDDLAPDEPSYDSGVDDLYQVLSRSMEQPDPDPNLDSSGIAAHPRGPNGPDQDREPARRGNVPRTSEVFRAVVLSDLGAPTAAGSGETRLLSGEMAVSVLDLIDRPAGTSLGSPPSGGREDVTVLWGQIALLTYSSALTFGLIWMFWTGRIPRHADPAPVAAEPSAAARRPSALAPTVASPPLPAENIAAIGRTVRLGDLDVTPLSIEAMPVVLVGTIEPDRRRREDGCLVLRLRLTNRSKDQVFSPLDPTLVRERDLHAYDPYLVGSNGATIRYFPLAIDSEWSIRGQNFSDLQPGDSVETLVASEPGSADQVADEMTWRVRLRIGVYRSDMLGVRFKRSDVRHPPGYRWEDEE